MERMWKDEQEIETTKSHEAAVFRKTEAFQKKKMETSDIHRIFNRTYRGVCHYFSHADHTYHYKLFYVGFGNIIQLRNGFCNNGYRRKSIYSGKGKFEVYS